MRKQLKASNVNNDEAAKISEDSKQNAAAAWKRVAPVKYRDILDAEEEDASIK